MPLLGWLVPALSFSVPMTQVLHSWRSVAADRHMAQAHRATQNARPGTFENASDSSFRPETLRKNDAIPAQSDQRAASSAIVPASPAAQRVDRSIPWLMILITIYLAVALFLMARFVLGLLFSRRLIRSSSPICEPGAVASFSRCAAAFGFSAPPRFVESEHISVPLTMGVRSPIILFPIDWREWDGEKLNAVLAHELSHCARHDALVQHLALLHRAIFWFSPLSWWLNRRIAELAEEASDEAALASGVDRAEYAETLLSFFEALEASSGRIWWQGMSMAKSGTAEQRVDRILAWKGAVSMNVKKSFVFAILLIAVPVVLVAAALHPVDVSATLQAAPQAPASPRRPALAPPAAG
ncbi:MAG: M56 family metallopeptidase [Candidatus Acidiferrum sp.]